MPVINIKMTPAKSEVKREIIKEVTKTISTITKEPAEAFTIVIDEVSTDDFGIGGHQLTEMIESMNKGK